MHQVISPQQYLHIARKIKHSVNTFQQDQDMQETPHILRLPPTVTKPYTKLLAVQ